MFSVTLTYILFYITILFISTFEIFTVIFCRYLNAILLWRYLIPSQNYYFACSLSKFYWTKYFRLFRLQKHVSKCKRTLNHSKKWNVFSKFSNSIKILLLLDRHSKLQQALPDRLSGTHSELKKRHKSNSSQCKIRNESKKDREKK